jgi:outer membrane protein OmpA-like peptidoglycan-associated protein
VERFVEAAPPDEVFVVFFPSNSAVFSGLDLNRATRNQKTLTRVVKLLDENPSARVLIEGFANPFLRTAAEEETISRLKKARIDFLARVLSDRGIAPDRMILFNNNERPLIPFDDRAHWEQNRRVEMRIVGGRFAFDAQRTSGSRY